MQRDEAIGKVGRCVPPVWEKGKTVCEFPKPVGRAALLERAGERRKVPRWS